MAETFHSFRHLPKELRLQIWEQAMIEARPSRCIIIYDYRVVPFKHLISPLLLVNHESRTCAKAFYNVKLDVHAVPPLTRDQVGHLHKQEQWAQIEGSERAIDGLIRGYADEWTRSEYEIERMDLVLGIHADGVDVDVDVDEALAASYNDERNYKVDLNEHWADFMRDELRDLGQRSVRGMGPSVPTTGAFYVSPEHDVFVADYDCAWNFCMNSAQKLLGPDPSFQGTACSHISAELSEVTRQRVSTLALVRKAPVFSPKHCVFARPRRFCLGDVTLLLDSRCDSDLHWKAKGFTGVCDYFVLRREDRLLDRFLEELEDLNDVKFSD